MTPDNCEQLYEIAAVANADVNANVIPDANKQNGNNSGASDGANGQLVQLHGDINAASNDDNNGVRCDEGLQDLTNEEIMNAGGEQQIDNNQHAQNAGVDVDNDAQPQDDDEEDVMIPAFFFEYDYGYEIVVAAPDEAAVVGVDGNASIEHVVIKAEQADANVKVEPEGAANNIAIKVEESDADATNVKVEQSDSNVKVEQSDAASQSETDVINISDDYDDVEVTCAYILEEEN
jgi:hypothetical protein